MFTNRRVAMGWAMLALAGSAAHATTPEMPPQETVDMYAQRLFEKNLQSIGSDAETASGPAPAAARSRSNVQLLFISGAGQRRSAYLMLNAIHGKSVLPRDRLGDWIVRTIGADYVDIERDGEQRRLLLAARWASQAAPASQDE